LLIAYIRYLWSDQSYRKCVCKHGGEQRSCCVITSRRFCDSVCQCCA